MHVVRRPLGIALALTLLGCGSELKPLGGHHHALTSPWLEMHLPVDGGRITYADEESMSMHFETAPAALGDAFHEALALNEWELDFDLSSDDVLHRTYRKDERRLLLVAQDTGSQTLLTLTSRAP